MAEPDLPMDASAEALAPEARALVAGARSGTLCTLAHDPAGHPFGSLVVYALAGAHPLFLISDLAEHTANLRRDSRASLFVAARGDGDILARARATLLGRCARIEPGGELETARRLYLAAHPSADRYAGFGDFSFWRLAVTSVRYVAGFGRMSWIRREAWETRPER